MEGLEIIIDNTKVDLPDDIQISVSFKNPMFSEKRINEAYSLGFNLPATPKLNNLLKSSNRVDADSRQFKLDVKIKMHGVVFFIGEIRLEKTSALSYSCFVYNRSMDLYKESNNDKASVVDYGQVEAWTDTEDSSLTMSQKIDKWKDLIDSVNQADPEEGAFKFPMIKGYYEDPSLEDADVEQNGLNYLFWKGGSINGNLLGETLTNDIIITGTFTNNDKQWFHSISPCMRIEHMIGKVVNHYGFELSKNSLESIQEFKRLTQFSCFVADKYVVDGTSTANIHGQRYDLNKFVPDVSAWDSFKVLVELFNAIFIVRGGQLEILTANEMLDQVAVNMTRYCESNYSKSENDSLKARYYYDIDEDSRNTYNSKGAFEVGNDNDYLYASVNTNGKQELSFPIRSLPLNTFFGQTGFYGRKFDFYNTHTNVDYVCTTSMRQFISVMYLRKKLTGFPDRSDWIDKKNQLMLVSDEFPDQNELPERYYLILFHGQHTSRGELTDMTDCSGSGGQVDMDIYLSMNTETTEDYQFLGLNHPNIQVSEKNIHLADDPDDPGRGTFTNYHQRMVEFIDSSTEVKKNLILPAHKIKEMSTFKQVKHRIDSLDGGFDGIIKEFKVQLNKDSISKTEVTYLKEKYEE